jgi:topoisomerase-4 subunit B
MDDAEKDRMMESHFNGRGKIEVSRFKGLGEMPARQLKETTMDPGKRTLLRVTIASEGDGTSDLVERLMGRKPELRFAFIQENARFVRELDV